jgi:hypothetical protein
VNALSVMGGGGESNNEYLDSTASRHPDPYHKMRLGWTRPKVRTNTDSGTVLLQAPSTMSSTGISNESPLLIYEPGYDYNYYLIEYRGPYSFDDQITSRGVAIWEVVTDATTHDAVSPMPNGYVATGDYTLSAPNFVRGDSVMWTRNHGMFVPPWYDGYTSQTQMRLLDVPTSTSVNFRFGACPAAISCPSGKSYSTTLCRCVP